MLAETASTEFHPDFIVGNLIIVILEGMRNGTKSQVPDRQSITSEDYYYVNVVVFLCLDFGAMLFK